MAYNTSTRAIPMLEKQAMRKKAERHDSPVKASDGEAEYLSRMRARYDHMPKSQKKIANYISENRDVVLRHSITTLAQKIGTSPSAISRFCQTLHYRGFSDMKFCLKKALFSPVEDAGLVSGTDDIIATKRKMLNLYLNSMTDTMLQLDHRELNHAVDVICNANMVHFYANGGPGASANFAYQLFLQIGIPCNCFVDTVMAMMSAPHLKSGDVAVGISYLGNASAMIDALQLVKKNNVTIVGITSRINSPLGKLSDIILTYSAHVEDDLRYRHIARMCEIAILGQLQSGILNRMPQNVRDHINYSKMAIERTSK